MDTNILKKYISKTPDNPGIYRFQDKQKKDIYIGKASSIKKRLTSYTLALSSSNGKTTDSRIQKMITVAKYLTHIKTESDIEALILESQLIKQRRPQFNIMLRDDKQYFFVGFSNETFPHLFITHQPQLAENRVLGPSSGGGPAQRGDRRDWSPGSGAKGSVSTSYIGPFTDGMALKATLKYLRNIFPYCTCKQKHHNFCLNYHIGKCLGFCCLQNPEPGPQNKKYKQNIKAIKNILSGKKNSLIKELKKEMETAGKKHDFSRAIELRNKLERLERVFYNAQVIKHSEIIKLLDSGLSKLLNINKPIIKIEGYDISNIQGTYATGAMIAFINGIPDKKHYRKFTIHPVRSHARAKGTSPKDLGEDTSNGTAKFGDTQMLAQILKRRLNHPEWSFPDLILIDGGKGQVSSALATLKEMNINIPVIGLSKNEKHIGHQLVIPNRNSAGWKTLLLTKLDIADKNLLLSIDAEAHRFAISHYRKLHRKSV
ncbi:MAG: hypothetical protein A2735_01585 [Candidatus Yanofskybacteria bacterium RIFCSPHIGHO2_01_FULL_41_21]|uniref:Excinuclease ABC subunit C n=1 Tax=Candidatus Yanofskybacteria bacterium RIFCSPHIGHO2_01_FULL_41_21 TaxID=1802660 RepID=A0A1F8EB51_9BACT|nr:MAG: hypothetical protein A2735_01585 [Candidatus Yanofskybacteria bacterium RIFCSPHIGHO2_01_FULL_41_21]